jgi:hypothetical protein
MGRCYRRFRGSGRWLLLCRVKHLQMEKTRASRNILHHAYKTHVKELGADKSKLPEERKAP